MEGFYTALIVIGFFILRLGVPLLLTAAICYGLHRLDARWQAEAEAEKVDQRNETTVPTIGGNGYGRVG